MRGYMLNEKFVEGAEFTIDPTEPFFVHGHGLFETIRVADGRPLFLRPHVERMAGTARNVGMEYDLDETVLRRRIEELLHRTEVRNARLKLMLLARKGDRCDLMMTAEEVPPMPREFEGIAVGRAASAYHGRSMAGLKTMNYMLNRLAEKEGLTRGFEEVLFETEGGLITEGTRSNVFFVKSGVLATPSLDLPILPGVTRRVILHLGRQAGLKIEEGHYRLSDLQAAEEVFVTGSVSVFRPVRRVEEVEIAQAPGPVTRDLIRHYLDLAAGAAELPAQDFQDPSGGT